MNPNHDRLCPLTTIEDPAHSGLATGRKPRIAIFSLTGCEGCSLAILELEDQLLEILGAVEMVNFREGMSERHWDIDIGFVDGAISTPQDEEEAVHFRKCCKTLVAIGSCACLGGINTLKHYQPQREYRRYVYGDKAGCFPTTDARPLSAKVKVDYELPGCPLVRGEFVRFVTCILAGRTFRTPNYPVCVECKKRGVLCLYERGELCFGPVTRAGCDAICPFYGAKCEGCRGIISAEVMKAFGRNIREQYNESPDDVLSAIRLYGAYQEKDLP